MRLILLLCGLFLIKLSFGQKNVRVEYQIEGFQHLIKHPKTDFKDSISLMTYLDEMKIFALDQGYILFSIDSINVKAKGYFVAHGQTGDAYNELVLKLSPKEKNFLRKEIRINESLLISAPISPVKYRKFIQKVHEVYLNEGFPFAAVTLQNVEIEGKSIHADLTINRGPLFNWSEVHIKGDSSLNKKYVTSLIEINEGDHYSERKLKHIRSIIDQTPFVKLTAEPEVLFTKQGAELFLYLESVPVSSVNGIIGFQPDPITSRTLLTGDLKLKLQNVLKRGEALNLQWQSIRSQTQSLNSQLRYPYLFKTPFGVNAQFNLYKRDTTFLETESRLGIQYNFSQTNALEVFYYRLSSNLLSGSSNNPEYSDLSNVTTNAYGIGYQLQKLDYIPNPSRGYQIDVKGISGKRTHRLNDTIPEESSTTIRGEFDLGIFIPIYKRHVLHLRNLTFFYMADDIFENELSRFGGLQDQRGFNEDELIATTRTSFSFEYRFLLDQNSHLLAFFDATWYENRAATYYSDTPYGFGLGFSFSTNLGMFNISYAMGKQLDNPIQLSNSKIHFGYIAFF